MAKRRTKKQRSEAKHPFLREVRVSEKKPRNKSKKVHIKNSVKGQTKKVASTNNSSASNEKKPINMAEYENLKLIKKHLMKSLSLATLILSLEVVIYLVQQG